MDVNGTASWRFAYQYISGQWWQYGTRAAWNLLGISGQSCGFVGDGANHAIGNSWYYTYTSADNWDTGYWRDGNLWRFAYQYVSGQWWQYDANTAASFL